MAGKKDNKSNEPRQIQNRRARYDFEIIETLEAGIALIGSEVKSIYLGRAHLTDAFVLVQNGQAVIHNMDVEPYEHSSHFQHERRRERKLLLHRKEIDVIRRKSMEKGYALVPLKVYFKRGKVKVEIALARGKSRYDKREKIAADDARREVQRARTERD